jgi:hypothetical protein
LVRRIFACMHIDAIKVCTSARPLVHSVIAITVIILLLHRILFTHRRQPEHIYTQSNNAGALYRAMTYSGERFGRPMMAG